MYPRIETHKHCCAIGMKSTEEIDDPDSLILECKASKYITLICFFHCSTFISHTQFSGGHFRESPIFGETYSTYENGVLVDYWCSNRKKLVIKPEFLYSEMPIKIYCDSNSNIIIYYSYDGYMKSILYTYNHMYSAGVQMFFCEPH
jgi:hypothetical protein